jgi:hypothetical protein
VKKVPVKDVAPIRVRDLQYQTRARNGEYEQRKRGHSEPQPGQEQNATTLQSHQAEDHDDAGDGVEAVPYAVVLQIPAEEDGPVHARGTNRCRTRATKERIVTDWPDQESAIIKRITGDQSSTNDENTNWAEGEEGMEGAE